jgi:hypothetical protein
MDESKGSNARAGGYLKAFGSILAGSSSVADKWSSFSNVGITSSPSLGSGSADLFSANNYAGSVDTFIPVA